MESQATPHETPQRRNQQAAATRAKLQQHRQKLVDSIGADAYNGVNLFEGTAPLTTQEAAPARGNVDLGSPNDAGIDISSLIGNASQIWKAIK